jgi:hypothetical protein
MSSLAMVLWVVILNGRLVGTGNISSGVSAAWLAANTQSLRKYEHSGLTGSTVNSSTRSIVAHG